MSPLKNDLFLRALLRQPVPRTPLWMMRQAGRYLEEYRRTRAQAGSFMALAQNPELACEVTLQPLRRFALDAAILFSDILTIPDAMGLGLQFVAGEGPQFEHPLQSEAAIRRLQVPDMAHLRYVFDAVSLVRRELAGAVPLIGFAGSPFTLACYMIEGAGGTDYRRIKTLMYQRPDLLHQVLDINARAVQVYLHEQIRAGAQAIMIFDSWGGVLAHGLFQEFSLNYMQRILAGLPREHEGQRIPAIVFTKGGGLWLEDLARCGADALGVDWTVSLARARRCTGDAVALQGNLDPMALFGGERAIRAEVDRVLSDFGAVAGGGHVFNLGHGISQHTPPDAVSILVDAVGQASPAYH
ncbi:uroporphyrinogen decarboxylase [Castellaniella sp.]|uniref:uroporphyrinogen decarboxylase n=1 Tax=Castellaniella sp. TaxID=1955812 RepID=UPI00355F3B02